MIVFGLGKNLLSKSILGRCDISLDYEHMTVTNETMTFMNKMLSFHKLCDSNSDIRLELTQDNHPDNQSCTTGRQGILDIGASLDWSGNDMENCKSIIWDITEEIKFKFVMKNGQEAWCPLTFTAKFKRGDLPVVFKKDIGGFVGSKFTGNQQLRTKV